MTPSKASTKVPNTPEDLNEQLQVALKHRERKMHRLFSLAALTALRVPKPPVEREPIEIKEVKLDEERFGKASPTDAQKPLTGGRVKYTRKQRKAAKAKLEASKSQDQNIWNTEGQPHLNFFVTTLPDLAITE